MKRVLLTVHKFFPEHRAGTEVLTLKVGQELQRRGYEVMVLTADPPDLDARRAEGKDIAEYEYEGLPVRVLCEPLRTRDYSFSYEHLHPAMAAEFGKLLDDFQPDILHVFHAQNLSGSIINVANERRLPVVCSATDFWFVCPIVQLKRPDGSVCRGPSGLAANCLTCYTPRLFPPVTEFVEAVKVKRAATGAVLEGLPQPTKDIAWRMLYTTYLAGKLPSAIQATVQRPGALRDIANSVRAIMVPTKLMRDIFIENGINAALIRHVPFGIDTEPLQPFQKKIPSDVLRIGFIGTLFEHKGVDLLIDAFLGLPDNANAVLKIYGDPKQFPDYGQKLQSMLKPQYANAGKISFEGAFPNDQLGQVLANLDVLVVPSRWYENTPLVMQSALATRTPLIGTDLGGISELIEEGVNGFLFQLNDAAALREKLQKLLDDPGLASRLSANIPPERTIAQMVDDIESAYAS